MLRCGVECNNDIFLRIVILKYHRDVLFQVRQYVTPFTCRIVECFFGCLLDSTIFVLSSGQVQDFWGRWWFRMSVLEPVLAGQNWYLLVNWWNGSMNQPYQLELQYEMVASVRVYIGCAYWQMKISQVLLICSSFVQFNWCFVLVSLKNYI